MPFMSLVALTFKLVRVRARDQTRLPCEFGAIRSAVPGTFHTQIQNYRTNRLFATRALIATDKYVVDGVSVTAFAQNCSQMRQKKAHHENDQAEPCKRLVTLSTYRRYLILIIGSVCLCHGSARLIWAPANSCAMSVHGDPRYGWKWTWLARRGRCTASSWAQRAVRVDWELSYTTVQGKRDCGLYK